MNKQAWTAIRATAFLAVAMPLVGCKSDLNQQLLERELRMQEDQIYQLQDELQEKCVRLDRSAGENTSLRKQLGIVDADASLPSRMRLPPGVAAPGLTLPPMAVPPSPALIPPPIFVPPGNSSAPSGPNGSAPGGLRFGSPERSLPPQSPAPRGGLAPPTLDRVPPLSDESSSQGAAASVGQRISYEESLAEGPSVTHLVINQQRTECFDGDGDGVSEGLAVVFEPRDADQRLVTAAGDVSIIVLDPAAVPGVSGESVCIARWDIPTHEAITHFRRTSRARGLHFVLRFPGQLPQTDHLRLVVRMTAFDGKVFETDSTVATHAKAVP